MPTDAQAEFRFCPPPATEAGWLVCRRVRRDDAADVYEAARASLEHIKRWMPWATDSYDLADAEDFAIRNSLAAQDEPVTDASYVIRDRGGQFLGVCGLHARLAPGALEIGYWVDVRHIRRGVATLAAALITEAALAVPQVGSVEIHHDQANVASGAVPAKLGYTHVDATPDEREAPGDTGVDWRWVLRREEFPASAAARLLAAARA
jgi:RimJ/RimL family protein N-acetyltransferase